MQRYDGMHCGLRGCQGRLNGGIEMPMLGRWARVRRGPGKRCLLRIGGGRIAQIG